NTLTGSPCSRQAIRSASARPVTVTRSLNERLLIGPSGRTGVVGTPSVGAAPIVSRSHSNLVDLMWAPVGPFLVPTSDHRREANERADDGRVRPRPLPAQLEEARFERDRLGGDSGSPSVRR